MSDKHVKERLLKFFNFSEPASQSGNLTTALSTTSETTLATIILDHIRSNDRVLIEATVGWQTTVAVAVTATEVIFRIHRDNSIVYSTVDSTGITTTFARITTSFTHAETGVGGHDVTYTLTAQATAAGINVIGPVSLEGSVIDENET